MLRQEGGSLTPAPSDPVFNALVRAAVANISASTRRICAEFGISERGGVWEFENDEGLVRWVRRDGRIVSMRYQVAGWWVERTSAWIWAWGYPNAAAQEGLAAEEVREYGYEKGHQVLTSRVVIADAQDALKLAHATASIINWTGAWRTREDANTWCYFIFSDPVWDARDGR